ncbi:HP0495 family protein [Nitrosomonas sp. wSCUT-2]
MSEQSSLIEYPCDFPIKIMGKAQHEFTQTALAIVCYHAPDFDVETMSVRASKNGTYLSITCTIRATSRAQLDALYQALSSHPMIAVVL